MNMRFLHYSQGRRRRFAEEFVEFDESGIDIPALNADGNSSGHQVMLEAPVRVKAIGLQSDKWYYGALKGRFDMCYSEGFLDPSLQCEYIDEDEHFSTAEVVILRGSQLDQSPLAKAVLTDPKRPRSQWWVFFDNEPPYKVWKYSNLSKYNGVFNLTATYSMDSDIPRTDQRRIRNCVRGHAKYRSLAGVDYAKKKKKKGAVVAWFASECATQSKREDYVRELQKYIEVDVFGACGPLTCGSREVGTWDQDRCHERLLHHKGSYKFYLSFENSLCKGYVTEKLWMLMPLDVVPVVMGMADYSNMLPKDSYIDVRDFPSPKALANYLKVLDKNPQQYNQYIRNKNSLMCYLKYPYMPWECTLCERIHQLKGSRSIVYDLARFWGRSQCLTPKLFFNRSPENDFDH